MELYKEIGLKDDRLKEGIRELELGKEKLAKQIEGVELREKCLEQAIGLKHLEVEKLGERCREVEVVNKKVMEQHKSIELEKKMLEQQLKELELENVKLGDKIKEVGLNGREFKAWCEEVALSPMEVKERIKEFRFQEKQLQEQRTEIEWKKKSVDQWWCQVEMESNKFLERVKEFELKEMKFKEECREFELKERTLVDRCNSNVKIEPPDSCEVGNALPLDANLHLSLTMDGRTLQIFCNESSHHCGKLENEVLYALGLSADPAELVLDAMEGYYYPHLKNGDKEFKDCVVKRSCNLLLQQLMKKSPPVSPSVKKKASKVAFEWMTKMTKDVEHGIEIVGFLLLVGAYGLSSSFDADELLSCLEIIARFEEAVHLLRVLGIEHNEISGFIQKLIMNKHLEAVKFIYSFELVNKFPPEPLLEAFLQQSFCEARKYKNGSLYEQIVATDKQIAETRDALKCIEEYNVKSSSVLSPKFLRNLISDLEKKNASRKADACVPTKKNKGLTQKVLADKERKNASVKGMEPVVGSKSCNENECSTQKVLTDMEPVLCSKPSKKNECLTQKVSTEAASIDSPVAVPSSLPLTATTTIISSSAALLTLPTTVSCTSQTAPLIVSQTCAPITVAHSTPSVTVTSYVASTPCPAGAPASATTPVTQSQHEVKDRHPPQPQDWGRNKRVRVVESGNSIQKASYRPPPCQQAAGLYVNSRGMSWFNTPPRPHSWAAAHHHHHHPSFNPQHSPHPMPSWRP